MIQTFTPQQTLALPMPENDANAATIRDYLIALLATLWEEKDGFTGKRPFGNSDWDGDLIVALIQAGAIEGELDEDGYIDSCDDDAAEELISDAIQALGYSEPDARQAFLAKMERTEAAAAVDDDLDDKDDDE